MQQPLEKISTFSGYLSPIQFLYFGSTRDLAALVESKGFSTFLRLLMQSGLKQILMVEGPFTLFAPTDEAFSALDEHVLENMFLQANERENILLHHIVSGLITSDQIINGTAVLTLGGNNITFSINVVNMTLIVKANEANLIDFDIKASNGVIHVVDQLLLPPFHDNRLAMLQTPQYIKEPEPLPNNIIEMAESIGLTSMTEYLADAGLALPLSMKEIVGGVGNTIEILKEMKIFTYKIKIVLKAYFPEESFSFF
ncbi:hypothetical protein Avbf_08241 [Armadillidium vulgare]|nr:hypothetical protein Avbf_08241 [Armadillidium vulgare]